MGRMSSYTRPEQKVDVRSRKEGHRGLSHRVKDVAEKWQMWLIAADPQEKGW